MTEAEFRKHLLVALDKEQPVEKQKHALASIAANALFNFQMLAQGINKLASDDLSQT